MSKNILFFCEGEPNSLDSLIIRLLKRDLRTNNIEIQPLGGKNGRARFAEGFWKTAETDYLGYIIFRDRDFDIEAQNNDSLITIKPRIGHLLGEFSGSKTTIENYLLRPEWLFEFANQTAPSKNHTREEIDNMFMAASRNLQFYTAARYAIGKLLREVGVINGEKGTPFLNSTWLASSGRIPDTNNFTEQYALDNGVEHLRKFQAKSAFFTPNQFELYFEEYKAIFDDNFHNDYKNALKWYNGKDLVTAIQQQIGTHIPFTGKKGYFKFLFDNNKFDYTKFPDLVELKTLIETVANS